MLKSRIQMRFCFFVVWADERRTEENGQQKYLKGLAKKFLFLFFFGILTVQEKSPLKQHMETAEKRLKKKF